MSLKIPRQISMLLLALTAGCGGAQLAPNVPSNVVSPQAQRRTPSYALRRNLIYAGDRETLYILSYPDGQLLAKAPRQSGNMCSDAHGTVYVSAESSEVFVYPHGATSPSRSLTVPNAFAVLGCGTDPATGNLAVAFDCNNRSRCDNGNTAIAVYKKAKGTPAVYPDRSLDFDYCGYDNQGNLFAVGSSGGQHYGLAELPAGRQTFVNYALNAQIKNDGRVQWDGQYVTLQDRGGEVIYRLLIRDGKVKTAGIVRFYGRIGPQAESWIQGSTVLVPYRNSRRSPNYLGFFDYPEGGDAFKTVTNGLGRGDSLIGLTVSVAR